MRKFGGAVILMQSNLNNEIDMDYLCKKVKFFIGDDTIIKNATNIPSLPTFSEEVVKLLDDFSRRLFKNPMSRNYSDVITLGFWCRKASVMEMKNNTAVRGLRLGRGIAFHIAPSNVAVNFAYSLIASLLAGNINIVRLPSKNFEQIDIVIEAFKGALEDNEGMKEYISFVKYDRDKKVNDIFSSICDIRVIWGGDNTIASLRQSPIKARTKEICFADRYSICIINSDVYVEKNKYEEIAKKFYNDTYLSDQNACTSPKLVVWTGNSSDKARELFWTELEKMIKDSYQVSAVQVVGKFTSIYRYAGESEEGVNPKIVFFDKENKINRVNINKVEERIMELEQNSGLFFEYITNNLEDIIPICNKKLQTISVYGVDRSSIEDFVIKARPRGIDRVVEIGKTMDFSLVWDGYNLIEEMSREISILI